VTEKGRVQVPDKYARITKKVAFVVAVAMSLFQLYTGFAGTLDAYLQRSIHLMFAMVLAFLLMPSGKRPGHHILDLGMILSVFLVNGYIFLNYGYLTAERYVMVTPTTQAQEILGALAIIVLLEATRRAVGTALTVVMIVFLAYAFVGPYLPGMLNHSGIYPGELLDYLYLSTEAIYGVALGVSATFVAPFIIFAALLRYTGISSFFYDVSAAIAGRARGGPAKIAVVASAFFGMISGSGTANTASIGPITIPMMKKIGYKPHFAGAVEAVASTGGQIMPPVMGATAFVISAFTGVPYITICIYAIFPAILYFTSIFFMVHMEALKTGIKGSEEKVDWKTSVKTHSHMVLPIILLVFLLLSGRSAMFAGSYSILGVVVMSMFRKVTRLDLSKLLRSLEEGATGLISVAVPCAAAGIIIGVVNLTGLGTRLTDSLMFIAGGNVYIALIVAMVTSLILGMGMPTTPAYLVEVALVIPALIGMGIPVIIAHLFAFYFACISLITPPVAITAYAAAAIAGADVWKTGWKAFQLGIAAYIVPYMFVFSPALLLIGPALEVVIAVVTALIGVFCLAFAIEGYLWSSATWLERACAGAAALLLIMPKTSTAVPGLALMAIFITSQRVRCRRSLKLSAAQQVRGNLKGSASE
jgi:TRAP transporter 4TM/12TM fusion protein